ncbi:MAG TPA: hypothetical protein VN328_11370, partial [Thermodesulfovibrionales bacterium]|nr:hypothetical protein [Thermodesulfovibrionales bacterium]
LGTVPDEGRLIRDERELAQESSIEKAPAAGAHPAKKESSAKVAFEALLALLIEKGLITKEELMKKIKEKSG